MAVTVATPSRLLCAAAVNVTVGAASSSVIVTVTCWIPDSVPLVTPVMSAMTVSSGSSSASAAAVNVRVPVVAPAAITIWVALRV